MEDRNEMIELSTVVLAKMMMMKMMKKKNLLLLLMHFHLQQHTYSRSSGKDFHSNELRFRGRPCAYDSRFSDMELEAEEA